jgi:cobalamin biosynthetic protein CobC
MGYLSVRSRTVMSNIITSSTSLLHGGQLNKVAEQYAIPIEQWLDLSTGIAPVSYPIPTIPLEVWQRLPQPSHALQKAASDYYQTTHLLPIPGSQAIIQILPQIVAKQGYLNSRVWLPKVGYQEHRKAWQGAGYAVIFYQELEEIKPLLQDIVVFINPNNPSGAVYSYEQVAQLFSQVEFKKGLLIIDEAFMDITPHHSFIRDPFIRDPFIRGSFVRDSFNPQLIILRSIGKFFGLAGLRLGFVAASANWLTLFESSLGPWSINGPAQYVCQQALTDKKWQTQQRKFLNTQSKQLTQLLEKAFKYKPKGTALFQTVQCEEAELVFEYLCQQGIYVRLCDEKNALRFSIPQTQDMSRLQLALEQIRHV